MPFAIDSMRAEESRIQEAYARRRSGHLYSRFNPAYLFMVQEREQRFLSLLSRHGCASLEKKKILEVGCGSGDFFATSLSGARDQKTSLGLTRSPSVLRRPFTFVRKL